VNYSGPAATTETFLPLNLHRQKVLIKLAKFVLRLRRFICIMNCLSGETLIVQERNRNKSLGEVSKETWVEFEVALEKIILFCHYFCNAILVSTSAAEFFLKG
jgi:hypothetical protein